MPLPHREKNANFNIEKIIFITEMIQEQVEYLDNEVDNKKFIEYNEKLLFNRKKEIRYTPVSKINDEISNKLEKYI